MNASEKFKSSRGCYRYRRAGGEVYFGDQMFEGHARSSGKGFASKQMTFAIVIQSLNVSPCTVQCLNCLLNEA
jgi:hypothetical protein